MQITTFLQATQPNEHGRSLASMQGTFGAQTFSCAPTSTEALALTYLLRNTTPEDLHARLLTAVTSERLMCSPDTIPSVFRAFEDLSIGPTAQARSVAQQEDERHCARCHGSYLERDNGPEECRIAHDLGIQVAMTGRNGKIGHYYPCCQVCLDTTKRLGDSEWCVVGRHTTQGSNVRFNGSNVRDCWARRCDGATAPFQGMQNGYGDDCGDDTQLV